METLDKKQMTIECRTMNKIIDLAQTIKLTRNLSYLVQELQAMEMDKMFTILEGLIQQVADLTAGTATFATGVGPTGPATNVADVKKLLTDLKKMAQ